MNKTQIYSSITIIFSLQLWFSILMIYMETLSTLLVSCDGNLSVKCSFDRFFGILRKLLNKQLTCQRDRATKSTMEVVYSTILPCNWFMSIYSVSKQRKCFYSTQYKIHFEYWKPLARVFVPCSLGLLLTPLNDLTHMYVVKLWHFWFR